MTVLAAIGSIGTIVGAVYGIVKLIAWLGYKTPASADQEIDQQIQADKQKAEQTGRPV